MNVKKYRDRHMPQILVEAVKLTADNVDEIVHWCNGTKIEELDPFDRSRKMVGINVPTAHGIKRASEGDYVVKGSWGEHYRAKPGGFERDFYICEEDEPAKPSELDDPFEGMRRV